MGGVAFIGMGSPSFTYWLVLMYSCAVKEGSDPAFQGWGSGIKCAAYWNAYVAFNYQLLPGAGVQKDATSVVLGDNGQPV
jgi:hypothetical protein